MYLSVPHSPNNPSTHSPTNSFTHRLIHSLTHSLIHPLTHSLIHSLTHALTHPSTHPLTHSSIHSPTHPLTGLQFSRPLRFLAGHDRVHLHRLVHPWAQMRGGLRPPRALRRQHLLGQVIASLPLACWPEGLLPCWALGLLSLVACWLVGL